MKKNYSKQKPENKNIRKESSLLKLVDKQLTQINGAGFGTSPFRRC